MIGCATGAKMMAANRPVNFGKGADSPAAVMATEYGSQPYSGVIYVFRAKRADRIEIIRWDGMGLCLLARETGSKGLYMTPNLRGVMRLAAVRLRA